MRLRQVVRRHPVGAYFWAAFVISWAGAWLTEGPAFLRGDPVALQDLWAAGIAVLAGPCVAGLAMSYLVDGKAGLQDLFSRMARWRVGGRWVAPLLIFPALLLAVSLALGAWVAPELAPGFFAPGIVMGLLAGAIEEIGWTGYAFPRMGPRRGVMGTALLLGLLHALWHFVPDYLANGHAFGAHWLPYFVGFCAHVVGLRVLIVWVYVNTGSLLLAQLMHASSTGFFGILIPIVIAPASRSIFYRVYGVALLVVAVIVVVSCGWSLKREPRRAEVT